jgi:hypothetical protein
VLLVDGFELLRSALDELRHEVDAKYLSLSYETLNFSLSVSPYSSNIFETVLAFSAFLISAKMLLILSANVLGI